MSKMKPAILIVDDSLTVRMDLSEMLGAAGFETAVCETIETARRILAERSFTLVVLDVLLPDGDGVEFLRELKSAAATRQIPVMLLSTEVEVRDRIRGLKTGADEYVGKPYERGYLLLRARQLIGAEAPPRESPRKVLLVDDSATFREEFARQLESAGYGVRAVATGEEGLGAVLTFRPDLVLVDGILPGGIDGATVIRRLKQDNSLRSIPCLLLTASEEADSELAALEAGADAFLRKDTPASVILARLAALLRSAPVPDGELKRASWLGARKILTVDDSPTFLDAVSTQLRQEGYDVAPARSGQEALELLEAQPVDCILLDLRMPGLSGEETCRRIKRSPAWKSIPLLMLTAVEDPCAVVEGINAGADDYVPKSADFEVLKARVRAQLRRKQFEDEYRRMREELLRKELEAAQARAATEIAEARARLVDELENKNRDLESFTYAVSHDLRAPLRAITGFTQALMDDFGGQLPAEAQEHLCRVRSATMRMAQLIDALLELSRSGLTALNRQTIDLSAMAAAVGDELALAAPGRRIEFHVGPGLAADADARLMRVVLTNLLSNAWKFTSKTEAARVEVGAVERAGATVFFVRDNGAGFDSAHAGRLFQPFERLHALRDFPGAGIGLATVRRIIQRHGGEIWAEGAVGQGAIFRFTLGARDLAPVWASPGEEPIATPAQVGIGR